MVIGFAGAIGAGKTSAAEYLRDRHGFGYARYSAVLAEMAGDSIADRSLLQAFGSEVMERRQAELNENLIARLTGHTHYAVDGLRSEVDFDSLKKHFAESFFLIFIDASVVTRLIRQLINKRFETEAAFRRADCHPVEQQSQRLKARAFACINNEMPMKAYLNEIEAVLMLAVEEVDG